MSKKYYFYTLQNKKTKKFITAFSHPELYHNKEPNNCHIFDGTLSECKRFDEQKDVEGKVPIGYVPVKITCTVVEIKEIINEN